MEKEAHISKISVRNLVEFILRSGDIDNSGSGMRDSAEAMQEGSKIHRMIQKGMGSNYSAEVLIKWEQMMEAGDRSILICVEGRADGIIRNGQEGKEPAVVIDEIKGVYMDVTRLKEAVPIHRAQAMCYAAIYAEQHSLEQIGVRMTYCNIESKRTKLFEESFHANDLGEWFSKLVEDYLKWVVWELKWKEKRNQSIREVAFPFPYREGQKKLVTGVYLTISRKLNLFLQAPTGVGKTISTVFPTVKAMGEGAVERIFYLTAKTITRTVAEETFQMLIKKGMKLKLVTITAKDKICVLDKPECDPISCFRAKGHYDRVNDAVFDLLTSEEMISRDLIMEYAKRHNVCPFEMCLDTTLWVDGIICDYNYVFDPNVYLRRFFATDKKNDYVFLIDEAHNLVDRAREMYSAVLYKQSFLDIKKIIRGMSKPLEKHLIACNKILLDLKRECNDCEVVESVGDFGLQLMRLMASLEEFMKEVIPQNPGFQYSEKILEQYLEVRHFLNMFEWMDENYITYTDYSDDGEFRIKLQCMNPSVNLNSFLQKGRSAVFFSATLLPIRYYKEQLGGKEEDYAVYAESAFDSSNRLLMVGRDVSTKYSRRSKSEFDKIASYIVDFARGKKGNYLIFFPSYKMMNEVGRRCEEISFKESDISWNRQKGNMTEQEKEEFLGYFEEQTEETRVGLCVMGGIFSEGIDLREDRLIGAVIVGTGLPMVGNERELFRDYYEEKKNMGFEFAYLYPGMNKVLQAAGRVIRTTEDKGAILLLDERFLGRSYQSLFPREWDTFQVVDRKGMCKALEEFWKNP